MKAPRMSGSTRTIWIMAVTAVISLGAGLGLSRLIVSPADAAANAAPPAAGPITVPVELRALANDIVLRGDAVYEDPVDVVVETGDLGGPAVVTGQVREVGATLEAGSVVLEVAGRPVILLPGELPVYRTLRVGVAGPDVLQLKAALVALGLDPGDETSASYDASTATAVQALYARVGYEAPTGGEDADEMVSAARDGVRSAEEQVGSAQRALSSARRGLPQSERIGLDTAVNAAQARLEALRAGCPAAPAPDPDAPPCVPPSAAELAEAQGAFDQAVAARAEALAAPETAEEQAALASAQRALDDAREQLAEAQQDVLTPLPASEVVYLSSLPRRVDDVAVRRGSTVSGTAVMTVSGATLQIAGMVSADDAALVAVGTPVSIALPDGTDAPGTVQSVGEEAAQQEPGDGGAGDGQGGTQGADGRKRVVVVPDALTDEQRAQLQGANVRITIPVSATEGDVLAVPTAALTAGPGGEARVEVVGEDDETTLVTVETGLAADGYVEVTAVDGTLAEGDRVVVGVTGDEEPAEGEDAGTQDEGSEDEGSGS